MTVIERNDNEILKVALMLANDFMTTKLHSNVDHYKLKLRQGEDNIGLSFYDQQTLLKNTHDLRRGVQKSVRSGHFQA